MPRLETLPPFGWPFKGQGRSRASTRPGRTRRGQRRSTSVRLTALVTLAVAGGSGGSDRNGGAAAAGPALGPRGRYGAELAGARIRGCPRPTSGALGGACPDYLILQKRVNPPPLRTKLADSGCSLDQQRAPTLQVRSLLTPVREALLCRKDSVSVPAAPAAATPCAWSKPSPRCVSRPVAATSGRWVAQCSVRRAVRRGGRRSSCPCGPTTSSSTRSCRQKRPCGRSSRRSARAGRGPRPGRRAIGGCRSSSARRAHLKDPGILPVRRSRPSAVVRPGGTCRAPRRLPAT